MDQIDLGNTALMAAEHARLTQEGTEISRLQYSLFEAPSTVVQHEVDITLPQDLIRNQWKAAIIVCCKEIASPVQCFATLQHC